MKSMFVAIFSYNRGDYLRNAVSSFRTLAPNLDVVIFDDASKDTFTREILATLSKDYQVYVRDDKVLSSRGGLHRNMQRALNFGFSQGYRYGLFTQDDVQVVRKFEAEDTTQIVEAFATSTNVIQVAPRFVGEAKFTPKGDHYPMDPVHGMLDVGIFDIQKLSESNWIFADSELENSELAFSRGWRRVHMPDPFIAHTPWPQTYRDRKRSIRVRLTDRFVGAGAHRYVPMTAEEVFELRSRTRATLPTAEEWLAIERPVLRPWGFGASDHELCRRIVRRVPEPMLTLLKTVKKRTSSLRSNGRYFL